MAGCICELLALADALAVGWRVLEAAQAEANTPFRLAGAKAIVPLLSRLHRAQRT